MVCKSRGIYGFLGPSWVLITLAPSKTYSLYTIVYIYTSMYVCIGFAGADWVEASLGMSCSVVE